MTSIFRNKRLYAGISLLIGLIVHIAALIVAVSLIRYGMNYSVPDKRIHVYSSSSSPSWSGDYGMEYVGGDAYNYQMEASLKAGYVSGVYAMKAIYTVGGTLLLFITLLSLDRRLRKLPEGLAELFGAFKEPAHAAPNPVIPQSPNTFDDTKERDERMAAESNPLDTMNSVDDLARLAVLHEQGEISDEAFQQKKADILAKL